LVVLRHAKAGELPGGPDFERVLLPLGQRDSAAAGKGVLEAIRNVNESIAAEIERRNGQVRLRLIR